MWDEINCLLGTPSKQKTAQLNSNIEIMLNIEFNCLWNGRLLNWQFLAAMNKCRKYSSKTLKEKLATKTFYSTDCVQQLLKLFIQCTLHFVSCMKININICLFAWFLNSSFLEKGFFLCHYAIRFNGTPRRSVSSISGDMKGVLCFAVSVCYVI